MSAARTDVRCESHQIKTLFFSFSMTSRLLGDQWLVTEGTENSSIWDAVVFTVINVVIYAVGCGTDTIHIQQADHVPVSQVNSVLLAF